ncbi:sensor histidine kinase [Bradyrhizobium sp. 26S5]|uniref:sensor histidine kinase n=2 Tax=unclassified Bradyrhizobium TaxID=2631580 RepID=UPI0030CBD934
MAGRQSVAVLVARSGAGHRRGKTAMQFWLVALSWRSCTWTFAAALAVAFLLATLGQSQAADPGPKRVLMLHSFGPRSKPWSDYAQAIRTEIDLHSQSSVEFLEHSLVNAGQSQEKLEGAVVEYLSTLYTDHPPDLIVALGAPAASFIQRHRQLIFPMVPMIITAVDQRLVQYEKLTDNDAVVSATNDVPFLFENIMRVLPDTKTIAIVNGTSQIERFWTEEMRRELAPLAGRVELKWYDELPFDELLKKAEHLPPHTAIFFVLMNVDAAGITHETGNALNKLAASASAPIFSFDGSFFGENVVGGPMFSPLEGGRIAAAVAIRILEGEKAGNIKTPAIEYASPKFDWRQMQRFGISDSNLPIGSTVYFRQPTVWERYRWQIASIVAVLLIQIGFISVLLREHRRRQLAEVQARQRMAELAHVNRFSTAGELTASIAHEINQPLGSILTNAETAKVILQSPSPDISELNEIVDDILNDDRRANEVIRSMRSLLKRAPFELKRLDLNDVARETIEFLSALAVARKAELIGVITPGALPVLGDRIQLQQVILNLVVNGIDAMKDMPSENRIISIRTSRVESFAQLSVSDHGPGIPEDKLERVFAPFYTSKAEGMGMGLSIARTIIVAHKGLISARNRDHGGASFRIRLPLVS